MHYVDRPTFRPADIQVFFFNQSDPTGEQHENLLQVVANAGEFV